MRFLAIIISLASLLIFNTTCKAQKQKDKNIFELINTESDSSIIKMYLKGRWESIEDKKYVINYDLNNYYEFYSKKLAIKSAYSISIKHINNEIKVIITFFNNKYLEQREIIGLTKKTLSVMINSNIIIYKRL